MKSALKTNGELKNKYHYMKKVKIHEFDPVIYPIKLFVCFQATREALEDNFNFQEEIDNEWFKDKGVTTSKCNDKEGFASVLVWTSQKIISTNYIAHEASHVANFMFEFIGEETKTDECYAYLGG